jgi:predicted RNase H-like nuclease (RuvC/YqgF family)
LHISIATIIGGVAGIVVFLTAGAMAGAYYRANWGQSTIELLTKDNDARGNRIQTLEHEKENLVVTLEEIRVSMDDKVTALSAQLMQSQERIKDLTELVTGATAVHALGTELAMLVEQRMDDMGGLIEVYTKDIRKALSAHNNIMSQRLVGIESGFARLMIAPPAGMSMREGDRREGDRRNLADPLADPLAPDDLLNPDPS